MKAQKILSAFLALVLGVSVFVVSASAAVITGEPATADVNADGKINILDVTETLKYLAKWDVSLNDTAADVDGDEKVNIGDVILMLKYIAGWDVAVKEYEFKEEDYGVSAVSFEIPDPVTDKAVGSREFGFDTEAADNSDAFRNAVKYLSENPGTHLTIERGTYRMSPTSSMVISGLKNCVIDWNGSTLIFDRPGNYFHISGCENFKFCNMISKWDWEKEKLGSLVKVKSSTDNDDGTKTVEMEFLFEEDASYAVNARWDSMIHYDAETLSPAYGALYYCDRTFTERTCEGNVVSAKVTECNPVAGEIYLIRHYNYDGAMFNIVGESSGIVIENNTLYGNPGCGMGISDGSHHVRITRFNIGLDPEHAETNRISTTADAIHIKDTKGYFILEDSDISFNGDDCLNIHDNVGVVMDTNGETLYMHTANTSGFNVGHTIGFKNGNDYSPVEFTATIVSKTTSNGRHVLTLDKACDLDLEYGMIVYDRDLNSANYIIRNNYFHENRARGLLLGSSNGLVENNRFYRIEQAAMNIPVDITTNMWDEGTGVNNLIIRNNIIEQCNLLEIEGGAAILFVSTNEFNDNGKIDGNCFENVLISKNRFINPMGYMVSATSVRNLTIFGNTVEYTRDVRGGLSPIYNGKIKFSGRYYDGSRVDGNTWYKTEYTPDDVDRISLYDTPKSTLTVERNAVIASE